MNNKSILTLVISSMLVPSAFAMAQNAPEANPSRDPSQMCAQQPTIAAQEISIVNDWLKIVQPSLVAAQFTSNPDDAQPVDTSMLINKVLIGKQGTSPRDGLRSLQAYLEVLIAKVQNSAPLKNKKDMSNDEKAAMTKIQTEVKLLNDTKNRIGNVLKAVDDFTNARQNRPTDAKGQAGYVKNVADAAKKVQDQLVSQFGLTATGSSNLLVDQMSQHLNWDK